MVSALLFLLLFGAFSPWAAGDRPTGDQSPTLAGLAPGDGNENKKAADNMVNESKKSSPNTDEQTESQLSLFIELLKSPSANVREHAASALGELGNRQAVPALIEALKDEEAVVREHVASALGKLGDKRAVEPLQEALQKEKNSNVQVHILSALKVLRLRIP